MGAQCCYACQVVDGLRLLGGSSHRANGEHIAEADAIAACASTASAAVAAEASAQDARASWPDLERRVADVWDRALALPGAATLADSFPVLGGESLLALRACAALRYELCSEEDKGDEDEGPEFGMLGGAFAPAALLAAPSLAAYCEHLRQHGHAGAAGGAGVLAAAAAAASAPGAVDWPAVRSAARRAEVGAGERLAALLDAAPQEMALNWCGAGSRRGNSQAQFTALHAAAQAGATECLQLLLSRRARPTTTEPGASMTPAHYAAMTSSACLRLLLEAGAPLPVRDNRGQSLLHAAARAGNSDSLRLLLATIDKRRDSSGLRALRGGEGTRALLEWTDRWARSAVHWAALNGHADALSVLLENGADAAPRLITSNQMAKRTHLSQEQPLALAIRVHGADSDVATLLAKAVARASAVPEESGDQLECEAPKGRPQKAKAPKGPLYLLTLGSEMGLDRLAFWELSERLAATHVKRLRCRIFFASAAVPALFSSLKSAEKLCAVVLQSDASAVSRVIEPNGGSPAPPESAVLEHALAQWIAKAELWEAAMKQWWDFNRDATSSEALSDEQRAATQLTFKVTCRRSGKRFAHVSTNRLAVAMASALSASRGWKAQVRAPDLEVRVLLGDSDLLVDVPLLVQAAVPIGGGELVSSGLAAPVAWALARSAELRPGDRVLDPMCGKAVILIEASLCWPSCHYLGLDVDTSQLEGAASNARMLVTGRSGGGQLDLLHGDARRLPLPDGCMDAIICDIPFGKQFLTVEECRDGLYDALLAECDRVVTKSSSGRVVLLSSLEQEAWVLRAAGFASEGLPPPPSHSPWRCVARREVKLGYLEAAIIVLRRPAAPGIAMPEGAAAGELPPLSKRLWWETSGGRGDWASLKIAVRPPMQLARGREI